MDEQESARWDVKVIWTCDKCGTERQEPEGYNEGGPCHCGGTFEETGHSNACEPRW